MRININGLTVVRVMVLERSDSFYKYLDLKYARIPTIAALSIE